jgi:cAMP-dependent protein kinase regulator
LALLYNDKRSATITALEDCKTYELDGKIFKAIIIKSSMNKRSVQFGFLDSIKLFENLDKFQKLKLVDGLQQITLPAGEFIIKEGDQGKEFYIIEEGSLECLKLHNVQNKHGFMKVRILNKGEHFGELALINNNVRSLSVRAVTECKLLTLDRESFTRILGSI